MPRLDPATGNFVPVDVTDRERLTVHDLEEKFRADLLNQLQSIAEGVHDLVHELYLLRPEVVEGRR